MAIKDINEIYEEYIESNSYRAFLFTPGDIFAGELDLIEPVLSLRKDGFDLLDFRLAAKLFDLNMLGLDNNPFIDVTLDGYYIIFQFGDLTTSNYQQRRFIIKQTTANLQDEQVTYSYSAISAEYELQKFPISNWPGVRLKEYKDVNGVIDATHRPPIRAVEQVAGVALPKLLDDSSGTYRPITLKYKPKNGNIIVFIVHKVYNVLEPLFRTSFARNRLEQMPLKEFYYDGNKQIIAWIPAHISIPTGPGIASFNDINTELYEFFIYYEPEEVIDEEEDVIAGEFEKAYDYINDGLTINQILDDLFQNLEDEETNFRYFLRWEYDKENSYVSDEVRSGLNFSNTSIYEMLKSLEENYQLYIDFDTINRKITLREQSFGTNNGLRFEYGKYLRGVSQDRNTDDIVTYLQGQDANGIGFADVSWSGDNYIENYDYYLDGVTWTPDDDLVGVSRWMSEELATVLAKIKYYQNFYQAEVWGNDLAAPNNKKGFANLRFDLQKELTKIDFEIAEVEKKIKIHNGLIQNYDVDFDQQIILNSGIISKSTPNNVITKIVPGLNIIKPIGITLQKTEPSNIGSLTGASITSPTRLVRFKSFKLNSSGFIREIAVGDGIFRSTRQIDVSNLITSIIITFKNNTTPLKTMYLTTEDMNKEISLNEELSASRFDVTVSISGVKDPENEFTEDSFTLTSLEVYEEDSPKTSYQWDTYKKYLTALNLDLEAKKTELQIRQNGIKYGRKTNFNPEVEIDEANIFGSPTADEAEAIGIGQLDLRLKEIQKFTSINHQGLSPSVLDELKLFRKGGVYANKDINNSKTLFVAARNDLEERIFPMITIDISSVSILQTYEGYEDWGKVRIGEKVDIFVPELRVDIEGEIVELDMNFQNYSTAVKISTVRNYDKSFGKIFSSVFLLAGKTSRNDVDPNLKPNDQAKDFLGENGGKITPLGGEGILGHGGDASFTSLTLANDVFIDRATDTLTDQIPAYYDQTKTRGVAQVTNGGIYIRDFSNNMRIKMNSSDGFVGYDKYGAETFKVNLDGFSSISMNQFTRGYGQDGIFLGSSKIAPILNVLSVSSPGSTTPISIAPSTGSKFFFKSNTFFSQSPLSLEIGDLVRFTNGSSVMYGFIKTFYTSFPNHIEVQVTQAIGTGAQSSWDLDIGDSKFSIVNPNGNGLKWDGKLLDVVGDIGGTIGAMTIGGITIDRTNGIVGKNSSDITKFSLNPDTGILTAVDGVFSGEITANTGVIGDWNIDQGGLTSIVAGNFTNIYPSGSALLQSFQPTFTEFGYAGNLSSYTTTLRGHMIMFNRNTSGTIKPTIYSQRDLQINSETAMDIISQSGGINISTTADVSGNNINLSSVRHISLHATNSFVYASRGATPSTADGAKITVGTGGVSTKIVKTEIQELNYAEVDNFLSVMSPKKFTNMLKNKQKISLIIEDEEEKNLPFKEMLFKKEEALYMFKELPAYLLDYADDEEVIKKEYNESGEVSHYYFSPKVIDEQTIQGIILASIKYNHERIKQLQTENENLKSQIAAIKAFVGMDN